MINDEFVKLLIVTFCGEPVPAGQNVVSNHRNPLQSENI